ncbi:unnamed protein product, partial [marine sediment metagenome]
PCEIADLTSYDMICVTGGEPMLNVSRTLSIIRSIRDLRFRAGLDRQTIYLYTALFAEDAKWVLPWVDGIHFSLHDGADTPEIVGFHQMQDLLKGWSGSARLYIDPRVKTLLSLEPPVWSRIEVKPWLEDGKCPLPEDDLLVLTERAEEEKA